MCDVIYPWGGRFTEGDRGACTAVVTLSEEIGFPPDGIALYGSMKTENLGVEKVVANVISNPNIRFVIVAGNDVRGHRSGEALKCLWKNGVDANNRIIGAKSAIPYIENLPGHAIERFQSQVMILDLTGVVEADSILEAVAECVAGNPGSYGEPMIVEMTERENNITLRDSDFSMHKDIEVGVYGLVSPVKDAG
jgi:tetrahydromethanopterin S-methyltransferase subunit A